MLIEVKMKLANTINPNLCWWVNRNLTIRRSFKLIGPILYIVICHRQHEFNHMFTIYTCYIFLSCLHIPILIHKSLCYSSSSSSSSSSMVFRSIIHYHIHPPIQYIHPSIYPSFHFQHKLFFITNSTYAALIHFSKRPREAAVPGGVLDWGGFNRSALGADFPTGEFFVQAVKWNQWEQCKKNLGYIKDLILVTV